MRPLRFAVFAIALLIAFPANAQGVFPASDGCGNRASIALVLAIDVSASIGQVEWELAKNGYVAAFRDRDVVETILLPCGRIAVTVVQWSSVVLQTQSIPWTLLDSRESIAGFVANLEAMQRIASHSTSIAGGIEFSLAMFDRLPFPAARRVVDISGNGRDDYRPPAIYDLHIQVPTVEEERARAIGLGVTINGLSIQDEDAAYDVHAYYRDNVITPDGFLIRAEGFEDFSRAIRQKLLLEIAELN